MSLTFKITNRLLIILFIFFSHTSLGISETLFKVKSITSLATEMNRTVNISSTSEAYRKIQIQSEITSKIKKVLKTKGSLIQRAFAATSGLLAAPDVSSRGGVPRPRVEARVVSPCRPAERLAPPILPKLLPPRLQTQNTPPKSRQH